MGRLLLILVVVLGYACSDSAPGPAVSPFAERGVSFVKSLVNPVTGLVSSREGECFTTIYKNSLAAMVFIHQGNRTGAEGILDVFSGYVAAVTGDFQGIPKDWNACTGLPDGPNYWEGDNAFLLLAVNYYKNTTGDSIKYLSLSQKLVAWLVLRSDHCDQIVAEGVANMYAALKPFEYVPSVKAGLIKLQSCFFATGQVSSVAYSTVLDHMVRGSLVFGDYTGFNFLGNFKRTENWVYDQKPVTAYSAFSGDAFINLEISAQLCLTAKIAGKEGQASGLQAELEKLWLPGTGGTKSSGLPYFMTNMGFDRSATLPIIDPTAYMLFLYWNWNPWSPGKKCSDC